MIVVKEYENDIDFFGGGVFYVASATKMNINVSGKTKIQALKNLRHEMRIRKSK